MSTSTTINKSIITFRLPFNAVTVAIIGGMKIIEDVIYLLLISAISGLGLLYLTPLSTIFKLYAVDFICAIDQ